MNVVANYFGFCMTSHHSHASVHIGREGKSGIGGRRNDLATFNSKVALTPYAIITAQVHCTASSSAD